MELLKPHKAPALLCMDDIEESEVTWFWYPYIPRAASTIMAGPGGVGKSHIVTDIAARVSTGALFPHDPKGTKRSPGRVLLMSAEDDADKVLKPNLRMAGANMKNIFVPETQFILDKQGILDMKEFMGTCQAVACFIDPIVAYMGAKKDMFRSNEVREVMGTLNDTARQLNIALIIVGHDRKNKEGSQQDHFSGSADFVNAPRSALHVIEDKYGPAMWHVKSNYGPKGKAISFTFQDNKFEWGDLREEKEPVFGRSGGGHSGAGEAAEAFLLELLKDGPLTAKEVEAAIKAEGMNEKTVNRAKQRLGIMSDAKRIDGKLTWFWYLPGQEADQ